VAIFLLGIALRAVLLPPQRAGVKQPRSRDRRTLLVLVALTVAAWAAFAVADGAVQATSRRMANLGYVLFVAAYDLTMLCGLYVCDVLDSEPSLLLDAINRNQLVVFLLGNLLTGAVNLGIRTMAVAPLPAFALLIAYMAALCGVAWVLHARQITLKFW
jgi:phosphatidylinositol glycan class W